MITRHVTNIEVQVIERTRDSVLVAKLHNYKRNKSYKVRESFFFPIFYSALSITFTST